MSTPDAQLKPQTHIDIPMREGTYEWKLISTGKYSVTRIKEQADPVDTKKK